MKPSINDLKYLITKKENYWLKEYWAKNCLMLKQRVSFEVNVPSVSSNSKPLRGLHADPVFVLRLLDFKYNECH